MTTELVDMSEGKKIGVNKYLLLIFLIGNLAIGSGITYVFIESLEPQLPDAYIEGVENYVQELATLQARELNNMLGEFESSVITAGEFLKEIWNDGNYMLDVDSYYHNPSADENGNPPGLFFSEEYDQDISFEVSSYKIAPSAFNAEYLDEYVNGTSETQNPLNNISPELKEDILQSSKLDLIYKKLYDNVPEMEWIYTGFADGFHRTYPWHELPKEYDPRVRPWYVGAETGSKDVVIILDKSGSMEGEANEEANEAVFQIINSLGVKDRFNIITFSSTVEKFVTRMETPTQEAQLAALDFLNRTPTGGSTNINDALVEGLTLLKRYGDSKHLPIVLFLTDGKPTEGLSNPEAIVENVLEANGPVDAKLVLFGLGDADHVLLETIANQTKGAHITINSTAYIQEALSQYSNFIVEQKSEQIYWTFPFLDSGGRGFVITAAKPNYVGDKMVGVTAVDLRLGSMVKSLNSLESTENGYSFVFDLGGVTVLHPEFSNAATSTWTNEKIRVPVQNFEESNNPNFDELIDISKGLESGVDTISYTNGERNIIAVVPIGLTSMVLGLKVPLRDMVPENVLQELNSLSISPLVYLTGGALGFIGVLIIYITKSRLFPVKEIEEVEKEKQQDIERTEEPVTEEEEKI